MSRGGEECLVLVAEADAEVRGVVALSLPADGDEGEIALGRLESRRSRDAPRPGENRMGRGLSGIDPVDLIDRATSWLRRHPFLAVAITAESVLAAASLGALPYSVALVLGLPAYALHAATAVLSGPGVVPPALVLVTFAAALDRVWRRLLAVAETA